MPITKLRGNTQIKAGTVDSTNVKDSSLITNDFSIFPNISTPLTTSQRDALTNVKVGTTILNTDEGTLDVWTGTLWVSFVATGTSTEVQWDGGAPGSIYTGEAIDGGTPSTIYENSPVDGGIIIQ